MPPIINTRETKIDRVRTMDVKRSEALLSESDEEPAVAESFFM